MFYIKFSSIYIINKHFKQMNQIFCCLLLITITQSARYHRLSTAIDGIKILKAQDSLVSTLGLFKATLKSQGCILFIQYFNNKTLTYQYKGNYTSAIFNATCQKLQIKDGRLQTQNNIEYLTVYNIAYNYSTTFTIDDLGTMRLIGTYIQENRVDIVSTQTVINNFYLDSKYVRAFSNVAVTFTDKLDPFQNQRGWKFIAQFGQLTIYYGPNPGINLDYVYSAFTIANSRIYDFDNQTLPGTLFTNITFQPRCQEPQIFLDFKPPYVFAVDPYWPIVNVYDQGGYLILQIALSKLPQYDYNQDLTEINYHKYYSPCPSRTFLLRGDCVAKCPVPYYHLIKGETGYCVLNCQQYSIIDQDNKICSCVTNYQQHKLSFAKFVTPCPANSVETPFGCACNQPGKFYDTKLSFSCISNCPDGTFGINSICMKCSAHCLSCKKDGFHRQFLQCLKCKEGYTIFKAQCVRTCVQNYGYSLISGNCTKCQDPHCINCSTDAATCLKCDILFTLTNGACLDNCTVGTLNVYADSFTSYCINASDSMCISYLTSHYKGKPYTKCDQCFPGNFQHLDKCVTECPKGYAPHNGYCVCSGAANLTIHDQCLNLVACPIEMYFDIKSHSCLSCPFGCISCINTQCIACNPGYFLYISPQNILCRRKSPLFPCNQQYSWQRNTTCALINYTDINLVMTTCTNNVVNCQICVPNSDQICVLCKQNFYLYNNTCITKCPQKLIPYDNTCILPQIANCSLPHLRSYHHQSIVTNAAMQLSQAYKYYIYNGMQWANDPVGYQPYFQYLTTQKSDGIPRRNDFFLPQWICLKCNDGFGLSQNFKQCIPCPTSCTTNLCYMANDNSCIDRNNSINCGTNKFFDQQTGTCLTSCNQTNKYPQIYNGKLYCKKSSMSSTKDYMKVDAAIYAIKDGTKTEYLVYFVFSNKVNDDNINVQIRNFKFTNESTLNYVGVDMLTVNQTHNQTIEHVIVPEKVPQVNPPYPSGLTKLSQNAISTQLINKPIIDRQYVQLKNQTFEGFILNLTQSLLSLTGTSNNLVFPSSIYGTVYLADHTAFMTTWLAYIGYIMSIVIILLHIVFIGNQLLYKIDNLLIFVQTLSYFLYVKNLVGRLLAQFYFGWSFSHGRFLPNLFNSIIPNHYVQSAPLPYKLVNMDGNYFRNAGFSLAWVLIYIAIWFIITFVIWAIFSKIKGKKQIWYPQVAKQSLIAGFQFFSMNLIFFSIACLGHSKDSDRQGFMDYFDKSRAMSIITLVIIVLYTIIRFLINTIGGLYMLKRIIIATILVFSYNQPTLLLPLLIMQLLFLLMRYYLQHPITKMQKHSIWVQSLLIIGCYFLLYFCVDAGVNTIFISIFIFFFIVYLAYDLITIYLESRNQFPEDDLAKEYQVMMSDLQKQRANTISPIIEKKFMVGSRGGSMFMIENQ